MAITVTPKPRTLEWSHFKVVPSLPDEDAHIDVGFTFPNKPFRKVDGAGMMAEELAPQARSGSFPNLPQARACGSDWAHAIPSA